MIVVHGEIDPREASSSIANNQNMFDSSNHKPCDMKTKMNTHAKKKSTFKKNPNQNEEPAVSSVYLLQC